MFVLLRRFIEIRGKKFPGVVVDLFYLTTVRHPVDMHVKYRHENADFHGCTAIIRTVVHRAGDDNFSIGR